VTTLQLKFVHLESLLPTPQELHALQQTADQLEELKLRVADFPEIRKKVDALVGDERMARELGSSRLLGSTFQGRSPFGEGRSNACDLDLLQLQV